jgi:thioredoxin-related protein
MAGATDDQTIEKGIKFNHSKWNEILDLAAKNQKLIFMDCYTSWCGPCKIMAKKVFTDPEVGEFFNQNFINVKMDMEKEPGVSLKSTFAVNAYPTLLIIDEHSNIIHKCVGALQKDEFLKFAKEALNGTATLSHYHEKYKKEGVANKEFVLQYLLKLEAANEKEQLAEVINRYSDDLKKEDLLEKEYWNLLKKYVHSISNNAFQIVLKHQHEFINAFGQKEVEDKIYFTFLREGNQLCDKKENGDFLLNSEKKQRFLNHLKKNKVKNKEAIVAYSEISTARTLKDWKAYIHSISKYLEKGLIDNGPMSLYNYALPVEGAVKDSDLRLKAAEWCDMGMKIEGLHKAYFDAFQKLKNQLSQSKK